MAGRLVLDGSAKVWAAGAIATAISFGESKVITRLPVPAHPVRQNIVIRRETANVSCCEAFAALLRYRATFAAWCCGDDPL